MKAVNDLTNKCMEERMSRWGGLTRLGSFLFSMMPATAKQMLIRTAIVIRQYRQRMPKNRRCFL